jgi:hypothetical protein
MLFQKLIPGDPGPTGYVLDLDHLDEPSSLTACAGARRNPRAVRFAAYDLVAGPTAPAPPPDYPLFPRHALESLFNCLIWFFVFNVPNSIARAERNLVPPSASHAYTYRARWLDTKASTLSEDRTDDNYQWFVKTRREFLWDWAYVPQGKFGGEVIDQWLEPLRKLIGGAHFFSRWREDEGGYDWETLGGHLTLEKFMAILVPGPIS